MGPAYHIRGSHVLGGSRVNRPGNVSPIFFGICVPNFGGGGVLYSSNLGCKAPPMDSSPARCSQVNFLHLPLFFFAWGGTSQYDIIRDIYIYM